MKRIMLPLAIALAPGAAAGQAYVSVRATAGVNAAAERKLAEVAEPLTITLPARADPLEAARQVCGRLTSTYLDLLRQSNGALKVSEHAQTLQLPACFVVKPNAVVAPLAGELLKDFAARTVGVSGTRTIGRIKQMNGWVGTRAEGIGDLSQAVQSLVVPFATKGAMYRLKEIPGANPQTTVAELQSSLGGAPGAATLDPELRLESDIDPSKAMPVACPAGIQVPDAKWPFDAAAVAAAIARNDAFRSSAGMAPAERATIAVADNGVDGLGTMFPTTLLTQTPGEIPNDGVDNDRDGFVDDVYGANVETRAAPSPQMGKDRWHGTHLAGLATGLQSFIDPASAAAIARSVRLLPISMVQIKISGSLQAGNQTSYPMPPEAVERAFSYAVGRHAAVINFSISTEDELKPLQGKLAAAPPILLVAAAGNLATNFAAEYRYPAAYGGIAEGPLRFPVISVAAHDRSGCLDAFSGRGQARVDLAAPGSDIRSNDLGGGARTASGTSQATALVSLAAGLLSSEGLENPLAIKERLIASVDPKPGLTDYVFSGGALNIVKALSLYEDVIELRTGDLLRGQVQSKPALSTLCPSATSSGTILKISTMGSGGLRLLVRWGSNGVLAQLSCPASSTAISYNDQAGTHAVPISSITDVVFRN